jgi:hypothetical protein
VIAKSSATHPLPEPVVHYIGTFVARRRTQRLLQAIARATLFTIVWSLGWCFVDRFFPLAAATRSVGLGINLVVVIFMLARPILAMIRRVNANAAAADIERREPRWSQRLRTVTSRLSDDRGAGVSRELLDALASQVALEARDRDATRLVSWRPVGRPVAACVTWLAFVMLLALSPWLDLPTLTRRYVMPWQPVRAVTTTRLLVLPGDADVTAGEPLRVQASAVRLGSGAVTLYVRNAAIGADAPQPWHVEPMTATLDGRFETTLARVDRDLEYVVVGGDARSEIFHVTVLPRPAVRRFRIRYVYPPYTGLPAREVESESGVIDAPVGTEVTLTTEPTRPLSYAVMTVGAESIRIAPEPASESATGAAQPAVARTTFTVTDDRRYTLRMVSERGVSGVFRGGTIHAIPDREPIARFLGELAAGGSSREVGGGDLLPVAYQAVDDYGLSRLDVDVRVIRRSGAEANASITAPLARFGMREQQGVVPVALRRFGLNPGDQVELRLQAEDRAGQFGTSGPVRLTVTSPASGDAPVEAVAAPTVAAPPSVVEPLPAPAVEPRGYEDAIRAYFESLRGADASRSK